MSEELQEERTPQDPQDGEDPTAQELTTALEHAAQNRAVSLSASHPMTLHFSSLPLDAADATEARSQKIALFNAISGDATPASEMIGEEFRFRDLVLHSIELTNEESGEIKTHRRIVFIDDDGSRVSAVSEGIENSLSKLVGIMGPPPYEPALTVRVAQTGKTKKGYNALMVELVDPTRPKDSQPRRGRQR